MSITARGGTIVVEFRPSTIQGAKMLGAHIARFYFSYLMPAWEESYRFSNMRVKISLEKESLLIGHAISEVPFVLTSRSYHQESMVNFDLMLTPQQVEAIEQERQGGDITFIADIYGEIFDGQGYDFRNERVRFPVNQKTWIDVLKAMNFSSSVLIELPLKATQDSFSPAWKAIEKAKEHLYYGNYDDVVANCRKALEGIRTTGKEVDEALNIFVSNRRDMTKRQRLVYALAALEHYTHPAHHVEGIESYSRNDAIFVLGAAITAVSVTTKKQS